jgi:hypothetical protein
MPKHYVTFGQTHIHKVNDKTLDCDSIAVYYADSYKEGREKAFKFFGDKFFTDYHDKEFNENNLEYFPRGYVYIE